MLNMTKEKSQQIKIESVGRFFILSFQQRYFGLPIFCTFL